LTRDLLSKIYKSIILFDQCPKAIEDAEDNTLNEDNIEYSGVHSMQDFDFLKWGEINAIYIRWCLGYLNR